MYSKYKKKIISNKNFTLKTSDNNYWIWILRLYKNYKSINEILNPSLRLVRFGLIKKIIFLREYILVYLVYVFINYKEQIFHALALKKSMRLPLFPIFKARIPANRKTESFEAFGPTIDRRRSLRYRSGLLDINWCNTGYENFYIGVSTRGGLLLNRVDSNAAWRGPSSEEWTVFFGKIFRNILLKLLRK
ncbi:hypothetical protein RCL_jg783.t1 [Rhizophagus clarus]|uniref:Uncharacterized protein n=1 Tax=Rhizophagus clarus TaxID=94130 RepID=A0A8H3LBX7_9GLOM|nr:hypothetical protein RCL_jg783.t1 [Rhizophagus clarus]